MSEHDCRPKPRPHRLRRPRFFALSAALVRAVDGLFARDAGQAGDRHRLYRVRLQQLPPPFSGIAGGGEARRAGGRRAAARISDHLARRSLSHADEPEIPQPDGDRHRGDDPRAADGRGGADGRLRQDRAGAADGRGLRRPAGDRAGRRADDDRALSRRAARRLHRLPALLGALPRRRDRRRRNLRGRGPARGDGRHLRGDGHRLDHGLPRRGARHVPARHRRDPGRACRPAARRRGDRRRGGETDRLEAHAGADRSTQSRSRTRCACCSRSAARPMRSSISPRSPDAPA